MTRPAGPLAIRRISVRRVGFRRLAVPLAALLAVPTLWATAPAEVAQAAGHPQSSSAWRACRPKLDGHLTSVGARQRTVTMVNQTGRSYARVSFWVRTNSRCGFTRMFLTTTGRIGYNGTTDGRTRKQGTGTTPRGTYTMTEAFGIAPEPGMWLPYHRVKKGDYWVEDNNSRYYNSLRNRSQGGFGWKLPASDRNSSEYLPSYTTQYRYAVVINFNRAPDFRKRYRGAGIFLHVKGAGATAGCVAISQSQLLTVMAYLHSGDKITITS